MIQATLSLVLRRGRLFPTLGPTTPGQDTSGGTIINAEDDPPTRIVQLERIMALPTPIIAAAYAEIALKGRNRAMFMRKLINNIKRALREMPVESINHVESRILVHLSEPEAADQVAARLREVFGLQWVSPVVAIDRAEVDPQLLDDLASGREPNLELLCETARARPETSKLRPSAAIAISHFPPCR